MNIRAGKITRRGIGIVAGLAFAGGLIANIPAHAVEPTYCARLQAAYLAADPAARPNLAIGLAAVGCSIPSSTTTLAPTTTTTVKPTTTLATTTTTNPFSPGCVALLAQIILNPGNLDLRAAFMNLNCTGKLPPLPTTTLPTSSTTSSSTTTTKATTTTTTIKRSPACTNLELAYSNPQAQTPALLAILKANGCTVPPVQA